MKIYDISQEVFSCTVYPGDSAPTKTEVRRTSRGDGYNLTDFSMCAHNGTHLDAPFHFIGEGKTVDMLRLSKTVGYCYVADFDGDLSAADACDILGRAAAVCPESACRILLRGRVTVTAEAAEAFGCGGIDLIGVESQSVGEADAPARVHRILLGLEVVLLEGLRLGEVSEGVYFLCAQPINLGGADGAPCRALLIDFEKTAPCE